jgi:hypothetical protein
MVGRQLLSALASSHQRLPNLVAPMVQQLLPHEVVLLQVLVISAFEYHACKAVNEAYHGNSQSTIPN